MEALFWLMRPLNATTASIAVIVALFIAESSNTLSIDPISLAFVSSAAFFVTAHAMVHNDIVDYEVDIINAPDRALPSGRLSMSEAKIWAVVLFVLAIGSGLIIDVRLNLTPPFSVFWAAINIIILDIYNLYIKKSGLLGNLIIGYVVSALFLYADILLNQGLTLRTELIGLYAFFLIWGREVYKGIRDVEGDRKHGVRTIAVRFGEKGGAIVGSAIILVGVLSSLPLILSDTSSILLKLILAILDLFIIYWCIRMIQDPTAERAQHTKLWLLRSLLIALILLFFEQLYTIYII